jgi:hypothetical protein
MPWQVPQVLCAAPVATTIISAAKITTVATSKVVVFLLKNFFVLNIVLSPYVKYFK